MTPVDMRFELAKKNQFNCFMCGKPAMDVHHIFNGAYKGKSEQYDALIPVCRGCHSVIHGNSTIRKTLKSLFQDKIMFENKMSMSRWIEEFGTNYMEDKA